MPKSQQRYHTKLHKDDAMSIIIINQAICTLCTVLCTPYNAGLLSKW